MSTTRKIKNPTQFVADIEGLMKHHMTHTDMARGIAHERDVSFFAGEQLWRRARNAPEAMKLSTALAIARVMNCDIYCTIRKEEK